MCCLQPVRLGGSKSRDLESEAVKAFGVTGDDLHSITPFRMASFTYGEPCEVGILASTSSFLVQNFLLPSQPPLGPDGHVPGVGAFRLTTCSH